MVPVSARIGTRATNIGSQYEDISEIKIEIEIDIERKKKKKKTSLSPS